MACGARAVGARRNLPSPTRRSSSAAASLSTRIACTTPRRQALRRRRIVRIIAVADLDSSPVHDESSTHEQALIVDEERAMLQTAMAQLPRQCRKVLLLRKIDGLPQKEVARRLGLSESTVEKHVAAGIQRCAAFFAHRSAGAPSPSAGHVQLPLAGRRMKQP